MSMKNSNDPIRNQTCDLPACGTVPQPNGLPLAPSFTLGHSKIHRKEHNVILNSSFWLTYCWQYLETNYSVHILSRNIKLGIFACEHSKIHMKWQQVTVFNSGFWLIYILEYLATNYTSSILLRDINTLRTGDADLRFYVRTVQDGWRRFAFLTRWNSVHLQVLLSATPQDGMFPEVSHPQALLGSLVSISWKFQFTKVVSEFVINF